MRGAFLIPLPSQHQRETPIVKARESLNRPKRNGTLPHGIDSVHSLLKLFLSGKFHD